MIHELTNIFVRKKFNFSNRSKNSKLQLNKFFRSIFNDTAHMKTRFIRDRRTLSKSDASYHRNLICPVNPAFRCISIISGFWTNLTVTDLHMSAIKGRPVHFLNHLFASFFVNMNETNILSNLKIVTQIKKRGTKNATFMKKWNKSFH